MYTYKIIILHYVRRVFFTSCYTVFVAVTCYRHYSKSVTRCLLPNLFTKLARLVHCPISKNKIRFCFRWLIHILRSKTADSMASFLLPKSNILETVVQGPRWARLKKKERGQKSRNTVPLKCALRVSAVLIQKTLLDGFHLKNKNMFCTSDICSSDRTNTVHRSLNM